MCVFGLRAMVQASVMTATIETCMMHGFHRPYPRSFPPPAQAFSLLREKHFPPALSFLFLFDRECSTVTVIIRERKFN